MHWLSPMTMEKSLVQDENFEVDVDATEQERQSDWVPTIKEPWSEQQVVLWLWLGQDKGLGAREWGERLGEVGALSFSQRCILLNPCGECVSANPKLFFPPTDLYFYFRDAMSLFPLHLQLAAVPKHSSVCLLYLNVCSRGPWFIHDHLNALPLRCSILWWMLLWFFPQSQKLLAMWLSQFYSHMHPRKILTLILKGNCTRIVFIALLVSGGLEEPENPLLSEGMWTVYTYLIGQQWEASI